MSILPLLDSYGQSLANGFKDESPFRKCPMKGCGSQESFLTPLSLINHLLLCGEAHKGNVRCQNCQHSHGMTRLLSPTQLWRRLSGARRLGQRHGPELAPPQQPNAAVPEIYGCPRSELEDTRLLPELRGTEGTFENANKRQPPYWELAADMLPWELSGTCMPHSDLPSATSSQTASRWGSGASHNSTLHENEHNGFWEETDHTSLSGTGTANTDGNWVSDAPYTATPGTSVTAFGEKHVDWPAEFQQFSQPSITIAEQPAHQIAPNLHTAHYSPTSYVHGLREASTSQQTLAPTAQHWDPSYVDVQLLSPKNIVSGVMNPANFLGQPFSGSMNEPMQGPGTFVHTVQDSPRPRYVPQYIWSNRSASRQFSRRTANRGSTRLPTSTSPRAVEDCVQVAVGDHDGLKCRFCEYRPKGHKKNRRTHLKRHEAIHDKSTGKLICPIPGCGTTFVSNRNDNLNAHLKTHKFLVDSRRKALTALTASKTAGVSAHATSTSLGGSVGSENWEGGGHNLGIGLVMENEAVAFTKEHGHEDLHNGISGQGQQEISLYWRGLGTSYDPLLTWPIDGIGATTAVYHAHLSQLQLEMGDVHDIPPQQPGWF